MRKIVSLLNLVCLLQLAGTVTAAPKAELRVEAELQEAPGNIAITSDGRTFVSMHQFFETKHRVVEVQDRGQKLIPFPNESWNQRDTTAPMTLDTVLGIACGKDDTIWMLDNGMGGGKVPKLLVHDAASDGRVRRIVRLAPPATVKGSFVNDLAVHEDKNAVFIADPANGADAALIVVHLETGRSVRVLEGHKSVVPENLELVIDGSPVEAKLPDGKTVRPKIGVNPIALDAKGEWLYYGPMHAKSMYRIRASDLIDEELTSVALEAKVERYSDKPICDGICIDSHNNIYITDLAANAIGVIGSNRKYKVLVSDPRLSWPDAFAIAPDGRVHCVANQLQRSARFQGGKAKAQLPFLIVSIPPFQAK